MSGNQPNSGDDQPRERDDQNQRGGQNRRGGRQQRQGQPRQQQNQPQQQPQGQRRQQPQGQRRQQPQGQRRQQPQGQRRQQRPPAQGRGSRLGGIDGGYVTGIVATMSIAGILMGVMSALLSVVGGFSALPGSVVQAQQRLQEQSAGGGLQGTGQTQIDSFNQAISTAHEMVVTGVSTELAPFVAFVLAVAIGVAVAVKSSDGSKVGTSTLGTLVGGFLFVALAVFVTSIVYPSVPIGQNANALTTTFTGLANQGGAILELQLTNLLLNAVVVGVVAGLTAGATTFSVDRFFTE